MKAEMVRSRRPRKDRESEGSITGPIGEAREEILRLIARLDRTRESVRSDEPQRRGDSPSRAPNAGSPGESPTVAEVRRLRLQLEERLSDARLAVRLKGLEKRVSQVEELVSDRGSRRPSASAGAADGASHTVSGKLLGQLMPDMLQLLSSNALTGAFVVSDGDQVNRLYLDEGQICHAEGPGMEGESAFFAIMALEKGSYYFDETVELPEQRTITGNTQVLILEALRQIDEGGGP